MDSYLDKTYLASRHLKDADCLYLNITFEVFNGCKWSCHGCHVNTTGQDGMSEGELDKMLSLLEDFEQNSYKPFIAFVGPTDFFTASNTVEFLRKPKVVEMLHRFKRLSFLTTYLDGQTQQIDDVCDLLNELYSDIELEINISIEPAQILNKKYLAVLQRNKEMVMKKLHAFKDIRTFGIFNVFDYSVTKIAETLTNYDFLHKEIQHLFETTIDYNFSLGRRMDLDGETFEKTVLSISELFDEAISGERVKFLRFSFGKLTDSLIEKQYNYRNGKFFASPLLYERFVSFRPEFEIPIQDWKAREFEQWEHNTQISQYANVFDKDECGSCHYLGSCIDRGVLHLMDTYGIKKCVVARDALDAINFQKSTIKSDER
ncbi:hypothetical protein E4H12_09060 [Candidatus Thorarchaeota archaeon]|nr:MAG: hypothetical protein E4H12_09060 [Candidatus Thorarchaeota archaeon]